MFLHSSYSPPFYLNSGARASLRAPDAPAPRGQPRVNLLLTLFYIQGPCVAPLLRCPRAPRPARIKSDAGLILNISPVLFQTLPCTKYCRNNSVLHGTQYGPLPAASPPYRRQGRSPLLKQPCQDACGAY